MMQGRRGRVFKRCGKCGREVPGDGRRCADRACNYDGVSWSYRVDVALPGERNADGTRKRSQRSKSGFTTKREATTALIELQARSAKGLTVDPSRTPLGEFLDAWLTASRDRMKPSSLETARIHIKAHIKPALGGIPLRSLTPTAVKALYADLARKQIPNGKRFLRPKTIHNVHLTLRSALESAVDDHLLDRNPAAKAHKAPASPDERETWTEEQLRSFLEIVRGDRLFGLWRTAATTGARRGELLALRWPKIDLERATLTIDRNRTRGESSIDPETGKTIRSIVEVTPKSARSRRTIDIGPETVRALREHRRRQLEERLAAGEAYDDLEYVFCRQDGRPYDPDHITDHFERIVRRGKLPAIGMHAAFRHLHGSVLLRDGVPLHVVSRRLGHANEAFTARVYAHVLPGQQAAAAATFEAAIDGRGK